jgi:hypothetical protein
MRTYARLGAMLIVAGMGFAGVETRGDPPAKGIAHTNPFGPPSAAATKTTPKEEAFRRFMPGTKITLKARKDKYFLGENILLDYQISCDGDGCLLVGTATGLGAGECSVVATDQAGNRAPGSTLESHGTGHGNVVFGRGHSVT